MGNEEDMEPTDQPPQHANHDALLKTYEALSTNFRNLQENRFKLLGLLPVGSVAAIAALFGQELVPPIIRVIACALGSAITTGLWIYDESNHTLIGDIRLRGASLEGRLGVRPGQFTRLGKEEKGIREHREALRIIYGACLIAWLGSMFYAAVAWVSG